LIELLLVKFGICSDNNGSIGGENNGVFMEPNPGVITV
jgi:hypothetical protein